MFREKRHDVINIVKSWNVTGPINSTLGEHYQFIAECDRIDVGIFLCKALALPSEIVSALIYGRSNEDCIGFSIRMKIRVLDETCFKTCDHLVYDLQKFAEKHAQNKNNNKSFYDNE